MPRKQIRNRVRTVASAAVVNIAIITIQITKIRLGVNVAAIDGGMMLFRIAKKDLPTANIALLHPSAITILRI